MGGRINIQPELVFLLDFDTDQLEDAYRSVPRSHRCARLTSKWDSRLVDKAVISAELARRFHNRFRPTVGA